MSDTRTFGPAWTLVNAFGADNLVKKRSADLIETSSISSFVNPSLFSQQTKNPEISSLNDTLVK
jgi:hypothetical protein